MKLIVLYGPEDSGKTTTLKIVYGKLKKFNLQENKRFVYLDRNSYLDFADVLTLVKTNIFGSTSQQDDDDYEQYNENSMSDFDERYESDTNEIENVDMYDEQIFETEQQMNGLLKESTSTSVDDKRQKVGIILEGDYGCKVGNVEKDNKTLFFNLEKYKDCDIIICACSAKNIYKKPINCIRAFVKKYNATAYIIRTRQFINKSGLKKSVWARYALSCEMMYAYCIMRVLRIIM